MAGGISTLRNTEYPGKLTWYVLITCIVAAMGGLIFGYDIGISGGVTSMEAFLQKFFPSVYHRQTLTHSTNQYCTFDSHLLTMFTSSLYAAALVASFGASWVTKRHGRKISMLAGGLVFLAGSIINASAVHISMLIIGRILLGVGVGFATQSVPLYVSEMAPCKYRGSLNVLFQLAITIGILVANVINYFTAQIEGDLGWRISLGGAAVPAIFMAVAAFFLPDTPNSLIDRDQPEKARALLRKIRGIDDKDVEPEFNDLMAASKAAKELNLPWRKIFGNRKYIPQLTMSVLIPAFQQLTGINVVMFYAPVLFQTIGFGSNASLMSALITGGVNCLSTFVAVRYTDKWGRRVLFILGGILMFIFQVALGSLIGWKFGASGVVTQLPEWFAIVVVACICMFVSAFAWSWGPLGWLVPSEIFPLEIRSFGQSMTVGSNMLLTFLVAQFFLTMLCRMKYGLFLFFAGLVAFMTGFVICLVPETRNIPIEEMSQVWREHWFWKKIVPSESPNKEVTHLEKGQIDL